MGSSPGPDGSAPPSLRVCRRRHAAGRSSPPEWSTSSPAIRIPALLPDLGPAFAVAAPRAGALWRSRIRPRAARARGGAARARRCAQRPPHRRRRRARRHRSSRSRRIVRPGDRIAVEDPCYPGIIDLASALGLTVLPVAIDDRGPTPDGLARALRGGAVACALTPRAQNPYGAAVDGRASAGAQGRARPPPGSAGTRG